MFLFSSPGAPREKLEEAQESIELLKICLSIFCSEVPFKFYKAGPRNVA
jgi:hypothetical protein